MLSFNKLSLILASTSAARIALLKSAGLTFEAIKPQVDEEELHKQYAQLSAKDTAQVLARHKALSLSKIYPAHYIIGADQTLEFEGQIKHKAQTEIEASAQLRQMSGKRHQLHSSVCVAFNNKVIFSQTSSASLLMRSFSDEFQSAYAVQAEDALLHSVGGYHYEGIGIQLFEQVDGDIHTILGMPMLPLLAFLREHGIIIS